MNMVCVIGSLRKFSDKRWHQDAEMEKNGTECKEGWSIQQRVLWESKWSLGPVFLPLANAASVEDPVCLFFTKFILKEWLWLFNTCACESFRMNAVLVRTIHLEIICIRRTVLGIWEGLTACSEGKNKFLSLFFRRISLLTSAHFIISARLRKPEVC